MFIKRESIIPVIYNKGICFVDTCSRQTRIFVQFLKRFLKIIFLAHITIIISINNGRSFVTQGTHQIDHLLYILFLPSRPKNNVVTIFKTKIQTFFQIRSENTNQFDRIPCSILNRNIIQGHPIQVSSKLDSLMFGINFKHIKIVNITMGMCQCGIDIPDNILISLSL